MVQARKKSVACCMSAILVYFCVLVAVVYSAAEQVLTFCGCLKYTQVAVTAPEVPLEAWKHVRA